MEIGSYVWYNGKSFLKPGLYRFDGFRDNRGLRAWIETLRPTNGPFKAGYEVWAEDIRPATEQEILFYGVEDT